MRAIVCMKYGPPDVLQLREVAKPTPKEHEVRIRIRATTVTTGDCEMRSFKVPLLVWLPLRIYMGIFRPRKGIFGQELAGEIEAVGSAVTRFAIGDPVFAVTNFVMGAHAEYVCLPDTYAIARIPANLTFEEAAAVPLGGLDALHFLKKANIQRGQRVLIHGAGGTIGSYALQLAKLYGAEVTGVDRTSKLEMLRSMGADAVVDFTQEDVTPRPESYDVIFDVVGKSSFSQSIRALKENGIYLVANPGPSHMLRALWTSRTGSRKLYIEPSSHPTQDLIYIKELIEAGKIRPVIDRRYPLEQMAEAHRYVDTGDKKGSVVITVAQEAL